MFPDSTQAAATERAIEESPPAAEAPGTEETKASEETKAPEEAKKTEESPPAAEAPAPIQQLYASWPEKDDARKQPWDLDGIGIPRSERELDPGKPNTVSPIVVKHAFPTLTSGSAGQEVGELARRLQLLGYSSDVVSGGNPFLVVTPSVLDAVERFREDYNVQEDPTGYGGNNAAGRDRASRHIGAWTWEGILRASDRELAAR